MPRAGGSPRPPGMTPDRRFPMRGVLARQVMGIEPPYVADFDADDTDTE